MCDSKEESPIGNVLFVVEESPLLQNIETMFENEDFILHSLVVIRFQLDMVRYQLVLRIQKYKSNLNYELNILELLPGNGNGHTKLYMAAWNNKLAETQEILDSANF